MSYEIILQRAAWKQLNKLSRQDFGHIAAAISSLEIEPRPAAVKKLAESGLWRIRVGQHRVVYGIDDKERRIIVVRIARRTEDTYKGF